jgi:hypothetical protein
MNLHRVRAISGATGKWTGRLTALLLLFWGMFFVEYLSEWFLRSDGSYPPAWVWGGQFLHLVILIGLGMMLKWDKPGTVVMVAGTPAADPSAHDHG